ncbi:MAG: hypothetical protein WC375_09225 [Methanomassiliicoccales archaeon]|jgi:pyridoxine 5'-phosphate synthase PdxJ
MDGNAEIDKLLAEAEQKRAAELASIVNAKLKALGAEVKVLKDAGISVSISLQGDPDQEKDSLEVGPADNRWKFYCNIMDDEDVKRKMGKVAERQEEARRLGIAAPPKEPKKVGGA